MTKLCIAFLSHDASYGQEEAKVYGTDRWPGVTERFLLGTRLHKLSVTSSARVALSHVLELLTQSGKWERLDGECRGWTSQQAPEVTSYSPVAP
jgi:hypothetical protein